MNVTCPQCSTIFRIDPAKVPEQGVRARCSVCSGLIAVRRPSVAVPVLAPAPVTPPPPPTPTAVAPPAPPRVEPVPAAIIPTPEPVRAAPPPPPPPPAPVVEWSAPPPVVEPSPRAPAARVNNPFLQQDPSTRARRLARALVSDLVVYYPEKRQRGLAEGNLKELFGEEIRKSWEEYTEQIGEELAKSTPYFTEALNEILAEGRPLFG